MVTEHLVAPVIN